MPPTILRSLADITPEWLTQTLRHNGALISGSVLTVKIVENVSVHAYIGSLEVVYSREAIGDLPSRLFVKICKPESSLFGDNEVRYYTIVASDMPNPPIPRCYHAAHDKTSNGYHLLLEDLGQTHQNNWNLPTERRRAEKTAEAFAQLHAYWWDRPNLSDRIGGSPLSERIDAYVDHALQGVAPLLDAAKDEITPKQRQQIERVFEIHPNLMQKRAEQRRNLTFVHGDPNPGNILSPNNLETGRAYLIDHQPFPWSFTIWTGASDLAYMITHWWDADSRRALETPILKHYLRHLTECGVQNYDWDDLWRDYCLSALQSLYVVADWCISPAERQQMAWVWRPQLQETLTAIEDNGLVSLLNE